MSGHPFSIAPDLKFQRGKELLLQLIDRINTWQAAGPVWGELVPDPNGHDVDTFIRVRDMPPLQEFSLIYGDALGNFREALDALIWDLATAHGKKPRRENQVMFPAEITEAAFRERVKNLETLDDVYTERIGELQPFRQPDPKLDALATLARLTNHKKHRGLLGAIPAQGANVNMKVRVVERDTTGRNGLEISVIDGGPLRDGLHWLRTHFDPKVELMSTSIGVRLEWQIHDPILLTVLNFDSLNSTLLSFDQVLNYIRTGEGEIVDQPQPNTKDP